MANQSKYSTADIDFAIDKLQNPLPVSCGGTGSETAEGALLSLGIRDELDEIKNQIKKI